MNKELTKGQEMMELVAAYYCEPNNIKAKEIKAKLQVIANSLDEDADSMIKAIG